MAVRRLLPTNGAMILSQDIRACLNSNSTLISLISGKSDIFLFYSLYIVRYLRKKVIMSLEAGFLRDVIKRFRGYKEMGDKTFSQLKEDEFFYRPSSDSNSIAIIVQHMYGNMLSRWTNFLTEDGEKSWRKREAEFDAMEATAKDIIAFWEAGWKCLLDTLESLQPEDLDKTITIRTEPLKVYDAILRQLAHYPYHVGQIVYIGHMLRNDQWKSLSIPKGGSADFLTAMQEKHSK